MPNKKPTNPKIANKANELSRTEKVFSEDGPFIEAIKKTEDISFESLPFDVFSFLLEFRSTEKEISVKVHHHEI